MRGLHRYLVVAMLAHLHVIATWAPAHGQDSVALQAESAWRVTASVTPVYQGSADIDGGGSYRTQGVLVRLGASGPVLGRLRGGVVFSYDYRDSHFEPPTAFGSAAPWETVQRIGLAVPLSWGWPTGGAWG